MKTMLERRGKRISSVTRTLIFVLVALGLFLPGLAREHENTSSDKLPKNGGLGAKTEEEFSYIEVVGVPYLNSAMTNFASLMPGEELDVSFDLHLYDLWNSETVVTVVLGMVDANSRCVPGFEPVVMYEGTTPYYNSVYTWSALRMPFVATNTYAQLYLRGYVSTSQSNAINAFKADQESSDFRAKLADVLVQGAPAPDAYEPDDVASAAKVITTNAIQTRSFHKVNDVDWLRFTVSKSLNVRFETRVSGGPFPYLSLFGPDSTSQEVNLDHNAAGLQAGQYYLRIDGVACNAYTFQMQQRSQPYTWTFNRTKTPILNGIERSSITIKRGSKLSGSFECWVANGPGTTFYQRGIAVVGFVDAQRRWIPGSEAVVVYSADPPDDGETVTVSFSGLTVPDLATKGTIGTYYLRYRAFWTYPECNALSQFKNNNDLADRSGPVATVTVTDSDPPPEYPPTITTANPLPLGTMGTPYNQTLRATGGRTPYVWTLESGNLPPGLSLSGDGVISGTPAMATTASFTVRVTGGNGLYSSKAFELTVECCQSTEAMLVSDGRFAMDESEDPKNVLQVTALSGEILRLWCIGSYAAHQRQFELRYYPPGERAGIGDGYFIGNCVWGTGRNMLVYVADFEGDFPKCFQSIRWINQDFGPNDCHDNVFRQLLHDFTPCNMQYSITLERYDPPVPYPLTKGSNPEITKLIDSTSLCKNILAQKVRPSFLRASTICGLSKSHMPVDSADDDLLEMYGETWTVGDLDFDGKVDFHDLSIMTNSVGEGKYRALCDFNGDGYTSLGDVGLVFPTSAETLPASNVASTHADLEGKVNANGLATSVLLHWGTSTNYQYSTILANGHASFTNTIIAQTIGTLTPNTTYHYRIAASNLLGVVYGADQVFKTVRCSNLLALTVVPAGSGTVSGGGLIPCGSNAVLKAQPKPGYKFLCWKENGSLFTNTPRFSLVANAAHLLTAWFEDIAVPSNRIVAPKAGQICSNQVLTVRGQAWDNAQINKVWYKLNDQPWLSNINLNGTNWNVDLPLDTPGTNYLSVYSEDTSQRCSPTNKVRFVYVVTSQIDLQTNGTGTIKRNFTGTTLQVGKNYQVTATPGGKYLFSNWSGTICTNSNPLVFKMVPNMTLQANFVPNPFIRLKGTYRGLFYPVNASGVNALEISTTNSGSINLTLTDQGIGTGKVISGSKTNAFSSVRFDITGAARIQFAQGSSGTPTTMELQLDLQNPAGVITGKINASTWNSELHAFLTSSQTTASGKYTFVFEDGDPLDLNTPVGYGAGTISVDLLGNVKLAGSLADGTAISMGAGLSKDGWSPLYIPIQAGRGMVMGWMQFANNEISATNIWMKAPFGTEKYYRNGFKVQRELWGSRYTKPTAGQSLLNWTNGMLSLEGGNLSAPLQVPIRMENNTLKVRGSNAYAVKVTVALTNGLMNGSFRHPNTHKTNAFKGVLLRDWNAGAGWFLGTNQSGSVRLERE